MSEARYAVEPGRPLAAELERVTRGQLALVRASLLEALAAPPEAPARAAEAVHEARKGLKRLRALARFVRGSIAAPAYERHNTRLRDAARLLASGRDAFVAVHLFQGLGKELSAAAAEALVPWGERLAAQGQDRGAAAGPAAEADRLLAEAEQDLSELIPGAPHRARLLRAAAASYGRCRRNLRRAARKADDQSFHEWRKSVKYVRHHLELLQPFAPELLGALERLWHDLADRLGDHNDLATLAVLVREQLDAQERDGAETAALHELLERLGSRQQALRAEALRLGRQLLAEPPRAYRARLRAYSLHT
jgi:CHAD domain-containing protein